MSIPNESPLNPSPRAPGGRDNRTVRLRLGEGRGQIEVGGRDIANSVNTLQLDFCVINATCDASRKTPGARP